MTPAPIRTVHTLDGHGFAQVVHAGTLAVVRECDTLDRINVFPVADADTGANLAATLRAASARLGTGAPSRIGDAARVWPPTPLSTGARGNSGAIVAQFLHGLAESFRDRLHVGTREFADGAGLGLAGGLEGAAEPARGHDPVGAACLVGRAHRAQRRGRGLRRGAGPRAAGAPAQALADTPHQLAVLARHNVVDAGGQGFVYFLEGVSEWVRTGEAAAAGRRCRRPSRRGSSRRLTARSTRPTASAPRRCLPGVDLDPERGQGARRPARATRSWSRAAARACACTCTPTRRSASWTRPARLGPSKRRKIDDMILQQLAGRDVDDRPGERLDVRPARGAGSPPRCRARAADADRSTVGSIATAST